MTKTKLGYRKCAGVAVFNRSGRVWIGRRINAAELRDADLLWQMPQGGIDKGENPFDAAKRELFEETNIRSVSLIGEIDGWLKYDLPDKIVGVALKGRYRGQKLKWFAFRFEGEESEIDVDNPANGAHKAEFDAWRWEELENTPDLIVPFKAKMYKRIAAEFSELAKPSP